MDMDAIIAMCVKCSVVVYYYYYYYYIYVQAVCFMSDYKYTYTANAIIETQHNATLYSIKAER